DARCIARGRGGAAGGRGLVKSARKQAPATGTPAEGYRRLAGPPSGPNPSCRPARVVSCRRRDIGSASGWSRAGGDMGPGPSASAAVRPRAPTAQMGVHRGLRGQTLDVEAAAADRRGGGLASHGFPPLRVCQDVSYHDGSESGVNLRDVPGLQRTIRTRRADYTAVVGIAARRVQARPKTENAGVAGSIPALGTTQKPSGS